MLLQPIRHEAETVLILTNLASSKNVKINSLASVQIGNIYYYYIYFYPRPLYM